MARGWVREYYHEVHASSLSHSDIFFFLRYIQEFHDLESNFQP
jgi:hypothetical protein